VREHRGWGEGRLKYGRVEEEVVGDQGNGNGGGGRGMSGQGVRRDDKRRKIEENREGKRGGQEVKSGWRVGSGYAEGILGVRVVG